MRNWSLAALVPTALADLELGVGSIGSHVLLAALVSGGAHKMIGRRHQASVMMMLAPVVVLGSMMMVSGARMAMRHDYVYAGDSMAVAMTV